MSETPAGPSLTGRGRSQNLFNNGTPLMLLRRLAVLRRSLRAAGLLAVIAASVPASTLAHEGHAALPSTGATVDGNQVLISEKARQALGLKTATVTLADLSRELHVRARVELPWDGQAAVTTLVPGRIEKMLVKPGERIATGQPVAKLESLELQSLQLAMLQAAEQLALEQQLSEQRSPLAQRGAIAGKTLLEADTELRQKRIQLAVAQQKLLALGVPEATLRRVRQTGQPVSSLSVVSPAAGVVTHTEVRSGQFVGTEQPLCRVVDRTRVLLIGEVPETDAWQVAPGQPIRSIFAGGRSEEVFRGRIQRLRLSVNPSRRVVEVVAPVDNPGGTLRPGMSGRMQITVGQDEQAIVCPTAALIDSADGSFVLVRQGEGKYERRKVTLGSRTPDRAEIVDGLFPGDRVIVQGTKLIASMFHADDRSASPSSRAESFEAPATDNPQNSSSLASSRDRIIPVAQAVVELPTEQKSFAAPIIDGRVAKVHVTPGQHVDSGQILAELDSLQLRNQQLELLETQETLRQVTETLDRVAPLARSGGYPQSQLWQHQTQQKTLEHQLRNIQRELSMVGLSSQQIQRLRDTDLTQPYAEVDWLTMPVRAPSSGQVADFDVALGQVVSEGDVMFEIQDLSRVWIEGYVFQEHSARLEVGQKARLTFPAHPELTLSGEVVRAAPTLHPSARAVPVWVEVENPGGELREGMLAEVEILTAPVRVDLTADPSSQL